MKSLLTCLAFALFAACCCEHLRAEPVVKNANFVQITKQYQYPNTQLVSMPGMIEQVVGEDEKYFTLSTPTGGTVKIPKALAQKVSLEVAVKGLIAERTMTNKALMNIAGYVGRLEVENKRLEAERRLPNAQAKVAPGLPANQPGPQDVFALLEGSRIHADDGTFLGKISRDRFAADSIANQFGTHGSKFEAESIFNEFGKYGGKFSAMSPYNKFSTTPPKITLNNGKWIYLTINRFQTPRLDPFEVVNWMKAQ